MSCQFLSLFCYSPEQPGTSIINHGYAGSQFLFVAESHISCIKARQSEDINDYLRV